MRTSKRGLIHDDPATQHHHISHLGDKGTPQYIPNRTNAFYLWISVDNKALASFGAVVHKQKSKQHKRHTQSRAVLQHFASCFLQICFNMPWPRNPIKLDMGAA